MASPSLPGPRSTFASPTASSPGISYPSPYHGNAFRSQKESLRRDSTTSTIGSISGVLDTIPGGQEQIAGSAQNAIATLIQSPIVRTGLQQHSLALSGFRSPTQRDIPRVTLTNIPHIESRKFYSYLSQVDSLYEAFQRAKQENDGTSQLVRRNKQGSIDDWEALLASRLSQPAHSQSSSTDISVGAAFESRRPLKQSGIQRRIPVVARLSTIPTVYSEGSFHLQNPRTFDIVSENSEIVRDPTASPAGGKTLATNAILQEKLSWYMDTVEIYLISSISTASKSFFSALGSLRELHHEAAKSVSRIQKLRNDLAKLDKEMAMGGLKIIALKQRRENVRRLARAVLQLEEIVTSLRTCDGLVQEGKIHDALDRLESIELLFAGNERDGLSRSPQPLLQDFHSVRALTNTCDDIQQLRHNIGKKYEANFLEILLQDVRRHISSTQPEDTVRRWEAAFTRVKPGQRRAPSVFPSYMSLDPRLRSDLQVQMTGLSRARHTVLAAAAFRTLILREMKSLIRKQLPGSNDDDNISTISASTHGSRQRTQQEKSSILARNLRSMDATDSMAMLTTIYTNISEGLRRLSVQVKILLDITSSITKPPARSRDILGKPLHGHANEGDRNSNSMMDNSVPRISIEAEVQQTLDLSSLLGEAVDLTQTQIVKIVKVRALQNAESSIPEFLQFFRLNRLFADECEAISGRNGNVLKSVVDNQIRDFVSHFGNIQRHDLIEVMDSDKWDAADFGEAHKALLAQVIDGSTGEVSPGYESSSTRQGVRESNGINGNLSDGSSIPVKNKARSAVIDEQRFILPESALAMLQCIATSQNLVVGISGMSQDIASTLLDCLKLFNSRTSQLILGAGATRSAGLKSITTKHLALASQSLSFLIALIPYTREFFRQHTNASSSALLSEFDKVKRLLQEHQNGIHEKVIDMMNGRAQAHINAMKKIDWEQAAKNKGVAVSPYIESLVKETATLQKVLSKHLPQAVLSTILQPVFASYKDQWAKAYQEVTLRSMAAKERMLVDTNYFTAQMSKLEGSGDVGEYILNVVNAKGVLSEPDNPTAKSSVAEKQNGMLEASSINALTENEEP